MRRVPAATKASRFSTCWLAANRFSAGPDPIWPASVSARYPLELRPRCCVPLDIQGGGAFRAFLLAARLAGVTNSTMTIGWAHAHPNQLFFNGNGPQIRSRLREPGLWNDPGHLADSGAEIYTEEFAPILRQNWPAQSG